VNVEQAAGARFVDASLFRLLIVVFCVHVIRRAHRYEYMVYGSSEPVAVPEQNGCSSRAYYYFTSLRDLLTGPHVYGPHAPGMTMRGVCSYMTHI
jgi:hypothetical protein